MRELNRLRRALAHHIGPYQAQAFAKDASTSPNISSPRYAKPELEGVGVGESEGDLTRKLLGQNSASATLGTCTSSLERT